MDKLTPAQRTKNMQAVKNKGSKIEILLAKTLQENSFVFETNVNDIFGKPDIVFRAHKVAVFCDSEFWHGKDWAIKKDYHKTNKAFWIKKIERNIERDNEVNLFLESNGWVVVRFWGNEIKKDTFGCIGKIKSALKETSGYLIDTENYNLAAEPEIQLIINVEN